MANKTAMTHLIEKILRMPESNIKGFLSISGPAYIEEEKEQIKDAYEADTNLEFYSIIDKKFEKYYKKTYGK